MSRTLATVGCLLLLPLSLLIAQTGSPRMNDKDLERLIKNAHEDAKKFSNSFKKALEKSSVRKTSKEKDGKQLADRFVQQTEGMVRVFDQQKKADQTLPVVYQSLRQIEDMMRDLALTGVVTSDLQKVKTELGRVSEQFSYTPPS